MITGNYQDHKLYHDGRELLVDHARKLRDHADDVLWGYGGSGPSMASLVLLLEFGATNEEAESYYQELKSEIIAKLPQSDFTMEDSRIIEWLEARRMFAKEFPQQEN